MLETVRGGVRRLKKKSEIAAFTVIVMIIIINKHTSSLCGSNS